jgi:hypothetical protein
MPAMPESTRRAIGIILVVGLVVSHFLLAEPQSTNNDQKTSTSSEKDTRTAAQRKINSQVLYEIYRLRGSAAQKGIPPGKTDVRIDARGRAFVDVRAVPVNGALEKKIRSLGGTIVSVAVEHNSILAWIPLLRLEQLAEDRNIRFIEPAAESTTH